MVAESCSDHEFVEANLAHTPWKERITLLLAWIVAYVFHFGQKRRSGGRAIEHPMAVANALKPFGIKAQVVGLFHDIVEDAPRWLVQLAIITMLCFGRDVEEMVVALTNWTGDEAEYFREIAIAARKYPVITVVKLVDKAHVLSTPFHRSEREEIAYLLKTHTYFYPYVLLGRKRLAPATREWCNIILIEILELMNARIVQLEKELTASPPGEA